MSRPLSLVVITLALVCSETSEAQASDDAHVTPLLQQDTIVPEGMPSFLQKMTSAEGAAMCHRGDKLEGCFGQQGPMCDAVATDPCWMQHDGTKKQLTSVGSLAHDMCCALCPEGQMCNEDWTNAKSGLANMDDNVPCALEWRKAVWNQIDGRGWCAYKEEARKVVENGQTKRYSVTGWDGKNVRYMDLPMTDHTQRLCAPPGQALDCPDCQKCGGWWEPKCEHGRQHQGDYQFCCSGAFKQVHDFAFKKWGTCA